MMPGDDKHHELEMDAADVRQDMIHDAAREWIRENGLSAAIGWVLTGDEMYYDKSVDSAIEVGLSKKDIAGIHDQIALMLVEIDEEFFRTVAFGG